MRARFTDPFRGWMHLSGKGPQQPEPGRDPMGGALPATTALVIQIPSILYCQEALHLARKELAGHSIFLRPRIFQASPQRLPQMDTDTGSEMSSSPGAAYTPTEVLFLKSDGMQKGVLQVHRAAWQLYHGQSWCDAAFAESGAGAGQLEWLSLPFPGRRCVGTGPSQDKLPQLVHEIDSRLPRNNAAEDCNRKHDLPPN